MKKMLLFILLLAVGISKIPINGATLIQGNVSSNKANNRLKLYEIRDYTIEPEWFDKYVFWAENHFIPYAEKRIDIIDFWVNTDIDCEVSGTNPIISQNGQPNITWVARYNNKEERDTFFSSLAKDDEWKKVWEKHPNPDAYIHSNARFFKSVK